MFSADGRGDLCDIYSNGAFSAKFESDRQAPEMAEPLRAGRRSDAKVAEIAAIVSKAPAAALDGQSVR